VVDTAVHVPLGFVISGSRCSLAGKGSNPKGAWDVILYDSCQFNFPAAEEKSSIIPRCSTVPLLDKYPCPSLAAAMTP